MKKLMAFVAAVVAMGSFAEDWVYPGTKGDGATREVTVPGGWTLSCSATKSGGKLTVNKIVGFPDEPAVLDLSGTFVDSKGAEFILGDVWGGFSDPAYAGREKVAGLVLPATGPTVIGGFYGCVNLASINCFPDTLKTIGAGNDYLQRTGNYGAFQGCKALTRLPPFPASLKTIYGYAFGYCTSLTTIDGPYLPDTVTTLGIGAFRQVPAVQPLVLRGIKKIERLTFREAGVTSVTFGGNLTTLAAHENSGTGGAFYGCTNLAAVIFADDCQDLRFSDEQVGYGGRQVGFFKNCPKLKGTFDATKITNYVTGAGGHFSGTSISKIILPELPHLPANYFSGMTNLSTVVFTGRPPVDVQKTVFSGLTGRTVKTLVDEEFKDDWAQYSSIGEVTAGSSYWHQNWVGSNYLKFPLAIDVPEQKYDTVGPWVFDAEAMTIDDGTWKFNVTAAGKMLTVGTCERWPDNVSPLDFSVHISDPDKVAYWIAGIDTKFGTRKDNYGASSATEAGLKVGSVKLPLELSFTSIGEFAFGSCTHCSSVTPLIPDSVTVLGIGSFYKVPTAGDLRIWSVATLSPGTFTSCTGLTSVTFGPALKTLNSRANGTFGSCTGLTNLVFDSRITGAALGQLAGGGGFDGCTNLCGTLDLSMISGLGQPVGNGLNSFFSGTKYDTVIISSNTVNMSYKLFSGMKGLKTVKFLGAPPKASLNTAGYALYNTLSQTITTEISKKFASQWAAYAVGGTIAGKRGRIDSAYLASGVTPEQRPILVSDWSGLMLIVK